MRIDDVTTWYKDGPLWHAVASAGPVGVMTACCAWIVGGATERRQGAPPRVCRKCREIVKDARPITNAELTGRAAP